MRALYILRTKCSGAEREVLQLAVLYRTRPFLSAGKERKIKKRKKRETSRLVCAWPIVDISVSVSSRLKHRRRRGWKVLRSHLVERLSVKAKGMNAKREERRKRQKANGEGESGYDRSGVERTIKVWVPCTFNRREIWRYCLIRRRRKGRVKGEESSSG